MSNTLRTPASVLPVGFFEDVVVVVVVTAAVSLQRRGSGWGILTGQVPKVLQEKSQEVL